MDQHEQQMVSTLSDEQLAIHRSYLRYRLYFDLKDVDDMISVRSSDNVVLEMKKSAAITQSGVLGDLFDLIPTAGHDGDEIALRQVSSLVLPKIISFCQKNYKFTMRIESTVMLLKHILEHLTGTVDAYKAWITRFVNTSRPLFSYLHEAADYLQIPTLFELTSMAVGVGDLNENLARDISDRYAGLSIPRMLSPMGTEAYSVLSQLNFFS
ncbi:hypothetical protein E2542_SST21656 [Spatholobus suberectus]|nr:hypothetical protein E2542_SST21656 [Spatholobus suberectus]